MSTRKDMGMLTMMDDNGDQQERCNSVDRQRRMTRTQAQANRHPELPGVDTLERTKALLLAALRVWELRHGIAK